MLFRPKLILGKWILTLGSEKSAVISKRKTFPFLTFTMYEAYLFFPVSEEDTAN
jgi:hypothetical protein